MKKYAKNERKIKKSNPLLAPQPKIVPDRLKYKLRRHLLSFRLSLNLQYWGRDVMEQLQLLDRHVSSEAGRFHLGRIQKFLRILRAELTSWRALDESVDQRTIPEEAKIATHHSGKALRRSLRIAPDSCVFCLGRDGFMKESCCGGRIKNVKAWKCSIQDRVSEQTCYKCGRYIGQSSLDLTYSVDLLVGSKECEDCHEIQKHIERLRGHSRELRIFNTDTDEEFRTLMDGRFERTDLFAPALFSNMAVGLRKCEWSTDDPDEILEYLAREDYIQNG